MRLIIGEDDVLTAHHLKLAAQKSGFRHVEIKHSRKELESTLNNPANIYLLDIRMESTIDGFIVAEKLKNIGVQFIFISANSDDECFKTAQDLAPLGFIKKPINTEEVCECLKQMKQVIVKA